MNSSSPQSGFKVPRGLDEDIFIPLYKSASQARENRFKAEFKRISDAYKLDAEISASIARDLGHPLPRHLTAETVKLIRDRVKTYKPIFGDTPNYTPIGPVLAQPPYACPYSQTNLPQGVIYEPYGSDASGGQAGGTIDMFQHGGVGVVENGFIVPDLAAAGTHVITVKGTLSGIYYLQAPSGSVAALLIRLVVGFVNADDPESNFSAVQTLALTAADGFNHGQAVGTFEGADLAPDYPQPGDVSNQFTRVFNFAGVSKSYSPIAAVVGIDQKLTCPPGSAGLVQTNAVITSIAIT
jgi:hypothetical protein